MSVFFTPLLGFLQSYGYPILWVITFVAAAGAPLPMSLLLLAAGAFSAQGDFDIAALAIVTTSASVAGDCVGYGLGRSLGSRVLDWLPESPLGKRLIPARAVERSRAYFQRNGGWAIFLTRVFLSALGGVTNLVAGAEDYPLRGFLLYDTLGETISASTTLGLGFAVGASWEAVGNILGAVSLFVAGALAVAYLAQRLWRELRKASAARELAPQVTRGEDEAG